MSKSKFRMQSDTFRIGELSHWDFAATYSSSLIEPKEICAPK